MTSFSPISNLVWAVLPISCSTDHQSNLSDSGLKAMILDPSSDSDQEIIDEKFLSSAEEVQRTSPPVSCEADTDGNDSRMTLLTTPPPTPRPQIRVYDLKKNNWGYSPRASKNDCSACSNGEGAHEFACATLRKHSLDPAFQKLLMIIQHFLTYLLVEDALNTLKRTRSCTLPDKELSVPSVMMAMGLDWDTTCTHPFLKRLLNLYNLEEEIVCMNGSESDGETDDEIDMMLCLKGCRWRSQQTKCDSFKPIPICPIMIQNSPRDDSMYRLRKWCMVYFDCFEQNQIANSEYRWPLPYFIVDGNWWRVGFAIKDGSSTNLYDGLVGSMGWTNGVQKVMAVLRQVIELTAERHREWYTKYSR
ncbi:hypothetical protein QM012_004261 [Aureobasidium pullulans]|uniref:Uncharacterized protein n=1 Tax=Aureobasidium pullulans TaxID=5580 RepID=A0ABR0TTN4_AURPU